jgi:hypothetical protein
MITTIFGAAAAAAWPEAAKAAKAAMRRAAGVGRYLII